MHPKILGLGLAAMGLHAWSISYCDASRSDGFVPVGSWPALPGVRSAVNTLLKAGLWERGEGGFKVHDYLAYNRSKAAIERDLANKIAAGVAGGQASAQARAQANGEQTPKQTLKRNPTPGPGTSLSELNPPPPPVSTRARARTRVREQDTDPNLLAEHLELMAKDRASRAGPSQNGPS
jgi:hypothetical protein